MISVTHLGLMAPCPSIILLHVNNSIEENTIESYINMEDTEKVSLNEVRFIQ
jgi:hypothetical protein